jgi:SPP1 gp7 family putative phage head morphogenesis protein
VAWSITADPVRFDEAEAWFDARFPLTKDLKEQLGIYAGRRAWTIAGVAQLDIVTEVFESLQRAIVNGTPLGEWKRDIRARIGERWGKQTSSRLETIFRTNVQTAYNRGRWVQMKDPAVVRLRPYWMFDALLDTRTTPICKERNGTVLKQEDTWWQSNVPPLHHRCRSSIRSLTPEAAKRRGGNGQPPKADPPDAGFGEEPSAEEWKPDPAKYPPELFSAFQRKQALKPVLKPEHTREHWTEQYRDQYGEAAESVAWGRAAEEAGLDLAPEAVGQRLRSTGIQAFVDIGARLERLGQANPDARTLRDLIAQFEGKPQALLIPQLRLGAATAGHLQRIAPHSKFIGLQARLPGAPDLRAKAKEALEEATQIFTRLLDRSVSTIDPKGRKVRASWQADRGEFGPSGILASFRPGSLLHEWAHALEAHNPRLMRRAVAFLQARTRNEPLKKLAELMPGHGYGPGEVVKLDKFIEAYIGKYYRKPNGTFFATEVSSVGMEYLALGPTDLYIADPEHFWFMLGQLAGV